MRAGECFSILNQGPGTYGPFRNDGGYYQLAVIATFGGGNVQLNQIGPDGATAIPLAGAGITAAGVTYYYLPPGQYNLVVTTATAVYAALTRVPFE